MTYKTYTEYESNGIEEGETLLLSLKEYKEHKGEFSNMNICVTKTGEEPAKTEEM